MLKRIFVVWIVTVALGISASARAAQQALPDSKAAWVERLTKLEAQNRTATS